jgi:hypothetical protein
VSACYWSFNNILDHPPLTSKVLYFLISYTIRSIDENDNRKFLYDEIFLPKNNNAKSNIINLTNNFIERALQPGSNNWESEGSAKIYSRCRALPLIISNIKWKNG